MTTITKKGLSKINEIQLINIDTTESKLEETLKKYEREDVNNRIFKKDHTVWKDKDDEISNRLGWLTVIDMMTEKSKEMEKFGIEIKNAEYHHIILLGMGGSSLGPEVTRQTFGSDPGYPELIVFDSTIPAQLKEIVKTIEPRHTLFIVSSKSGTTAETTAAYKYFWKLVSDEMGEDKAGDNFIAITDKNTPLADAARERHFRKLFINPSDIGGRYSILSYFGLVPAALTGMDIQKLLKSAIKMQERCAPCGSLQQNPAATLGALLGNYAIAGKDKLTLVTSPSIRSFGLWLEQLIAESTGKEGIGIIPVIGEPLNEPKYYGEDRIFVYMRVNGDENEKPDVFINKLKNAGFPVAIINMEDQYDLGGEFFRWEMATAFSGAAMKINPFNQLDVEDTKRESRKILENYGKNKNRDTKMKSDNISTLLKKIKPGEYIALMAYIKQTPITDGVLNNIRSKLLKKYKTATTLGYGPRFLHSTGQLHKGGRNNGVFIQITTNNKYDKNIPGENYTFGILTESESTGDYMALKNKQRRVGRIIIEDTSNKQLKVLKEIF